MTINGRSRNSDPGPSAPSSARWQLKLYIAGLGGKSMTALANLKRLRAEWLPQYAEVEVVDITKDPALARKDDIIALPTLIRTMPRPPRRVLGDLSNTERVLIGLGLAPA